MSTNLDEALKRVQLTAREAQVKDAAFEQRVRQIAREEARAVAEEVYAGRERAAYIDIVNALDPSALLATSPTDTGAGAAWYDENVSEADKPLPWSITESRERWRNDALAAERRIADLEQRLAEAKNELHCCDDVPLDKGLTEGIAALRRERDAALASLAEKERRIGELEEALKPFAAITPSTACAPDGSEGEAYYVVLSVPGGTEDFTGSHLAAARAALTPDAGEK